MSDPARAETATYAGDVSPADAWARLAAAPTVWLVDVRTQAEWSFVGVPDLSALDRKVVLVSWQIFPGMERNQAFARQLAGQGIRPDDTVLLLCRSGVRSKAAAEHLTALGYRDAWNITEGFEGGVDDQGHRGRQSGWKAAGLPWVQS
jgi:rhodanese-related sulfurtransferase